jgi:hypothetical protein
MRSYIAIVSLSVSLIIVQTAHSQVRKQAPSDYRLRQGLNEALLVF